MSHAVRALLQLWLAAMAGCGGSGTPVTPHDGPAYPERLSAWGIVTARDGVLRLGNGVLPYDLNTPLFSDYAHKLRTVWMPPGTMAASIDGEIALPAGTILSKTFFYPVEANDQIRLDEDDSRDFAPNGFGLDLDHVRLIETRLLVQQADGWDALAYVWNPEETDAVLSIAGDIQSLPTAEGPLTYLVPTRDECANCHAWDHTSGAVRPIGIMARHLDKDYLHYVEGPAPQLPRWRSAGYLDERPLAASRANARWTSEEDDLEHRARSYLDINCGHCHNPKGPADTSGLILNIAEMDARKLGVCKPPVAAGRGSGGLLYAIVPGAPGQSILIHRMQAREPDVMMPELGRTTVHEEGVDLLAAWIDAMPGSCGA